MERIVIESDKSELFCDPINVTSLLDDKQAMSELANFRNAGKGSKPQLSEHLKGLLANVYSTFQPVAARLIQKRIYQFSKIDEDTKEDIFADQNSRLWILITERFHWENYPDGGMATGALVNYLDKTSGSFFARDLIRRQKQAVEKRKKFNSEVIRPVENEVMEKEVPANINAVWQKWREATPSIYVNAVESRYVDGISIDEQAVTENLKVGTVKKRLIVGKKSLFDYLEKAGFISAQDVVSGKLIVDKKSRVELLEKRREDLKKALPVWQEILKNKPKLKEAMFAFYGLGDEVPTFDYKQAADKAGITVSSAKVLVSEGVRLLLGQIKPSPEILNKIRDENHFIYWTQHQNELQLSQKVSTILNMYFIEGLTHLQIAQKVGISEETVRRKKMHALELVESVINNDNENKQTF